MNNDNLRRNLIIALSFMLMAAIFIAGLTIAALGFIFLPFLFLFKRNDPSIARGDNHSPLRAQAIDAEFKRIENPADKE